jgi:peroxiredoxin
MKKKSMLLLTTILIGSISFGQNKKIYNGGFIVKVGDTAPEFTINEISGKSYRLSDLKGKVVMLQFTASWCSVCRTEMPFIEKEIWQEKMAEGLAVIGIDRDEPAEQVIQFGRKMGITYPLALDPGADIFGLFAEKEAGVTRNVVIDRSGKIIFLTRLFDRKKFDHMKKVIFTEISLK